MRRRWPVSSGRWSPRCRPTSTNETPRWFHFMHDLPETSPTAQESSGKQVHRISRLPAKPATARGTFDCGRCAPVPFELLACADDATYR
jgi:hypothetical protein